MTGSGGSDVDVRVVLLREGARLPRYMSDQAAGLDLAACLDGGAGPEGGGEGGAPASVTLAPGARRLVGTGLAVELPPGYEAQVRPRSGLALKHGVTVLNAPGTIDADYRGEVMVLLVNHGDAPFVVRTGDRIAQMVVAPVARARLVVADALAATPRGGGGYGHTGV